MALTAALLVRIPECGSTIVAGHSGQHQPISWAHSCEEREPWKWLSDNDLVMTTGSAIPDNPSDQCHYVEQCAAHGIVGMAIGVDMNAPELSADFLTRADDLGFVIMLTEREVPFIVLSRTIAASQQRDERARLLRSKRLYEAVLLTTVDQRAESNRLEMVGEAIGYTVTIIEKTTSPSSRGENPNGVKSKTSSLLPSLDLPIPGFPDACVRLVSRDSEFNVLDQGIRQHISLIAALELERESTEREKAYRRGNALLSSFIDGVNIAELEAQVHALLDLDNQTYIMVLGNRIPQGIQLFRALLDAGFRNAVYPQGETTHVLIPAESEALEITSTWIEHMGVSEAFNTIEDARTGLGQAQLAHKSALKRSAALVHFGERRASIIPTNAPAADLLIEQTLGSLQEYDALNGTEYVWSLRVFLEENRSWNTASDRLHVHKQTLVYRMRRVTEITGLHLDTTSDVALFWAALEAVEIYR